MSAANTGDHGLLNAVPIRVVELVRQKMEHRRGFTVMNYVIGNTGKKALLNKRLIKRFLRKIQMA